MPDQLSDRVEKWLNANPDSNRSSQISRAFRNIEPDVDSFHLALAIQDLVKSGKFRQRYIVISKQRQVLSGEYKDPQDIPLDCFPNDADIDVVIKKGPDKLSDRIERWLDKHPDSDTNQIIAVFSRTDFASAAGAITEEMYRAVKSAVRGKLRQGYHHIQDAFSTEKPEEIAISIAELEISGKFQSVYQVASKTKKEAPVEYKTFDEIPDTTSFDSIRKLLRRSESAPTRANESSQTVNVASLDTAQP